MINKQRIIELYMEYGELPIWRQQMKLLAANSILYLEEYQKLPDEIYRWKKDEELVKNYSREDLQCPKWLEKVPGNVRCPDDLCVGIGTYRSQRDGEIYMCSILNRKNRCVEAYSFGVYRSPELIRRAMEIFFEQYDVDVRAEVSMLVSRNPIYRTKQCQEIMREFPVTVRMTQPGTRGGAAVVSTYFSQLMRRKGARAFEGWQDAVNWLTEDILEYNLALTTKSF